MLTWTIYKMAGRGGRPRAPELIVPVANVLNPQQLLGEVFNFNGLANEALIDTPTCMSWLARLGLLANTTVCGLWPGRIICRFTRHTQGTDGFEWKCSTAGCVYWQSIRHDSFFSDSHLTMSQIVELIYHWAWGHSQTENMEEVNIIRHTAVDWFNFIRDCGWQTIRHR